MLHNLSSFHFGKLLQNACALPDYVYNSTHNKQLLRSAKVEGLAMTEAVTLSKMLHNETRPASPRQQKTSSPQQMTVPAGHQSHTPKDIAHSGEKSQTQPAPALPTGTEKKTGRVWKPGRGVVEKVDKTTGEIVHLCAE